ncbi:hypothetical protein PIB30_069058 [Stylosanthes scabra]|uniref:Uncharacterized protein n=1 Tax=Stylosanthes scabra TaxID=79078 RepID=A0ABU6RN38_9FABA|nr:hypothetical protein [Stylosanthes scabra]
MAWINNNPLVKAQICDGLVLGLPSCRVGGYRGKPKTSFREEHLKEWWMSDNEYGGWWDLPSMSNYQWSKLSTLQMEAALCHIFSLWVFANINAKKGRLGSAVSSLTVEFEVVGSNSLSTKVGVRLLVYSLPQHPTKWDLNWVGPSVFLFPLLIN